jgi:hypothetical protein
MVIFVFMSKFGESYLWSQSTSITLKTSNEIWCSVHSREICYPHLSRSSSSLSCDRSIASSNECDPELPSTSSSFLRLLPRFLVPLIFPLMTCFRRQFLRNMCPSSWPSFVLLCEECSFSPLLWVTLLHYLRGPSNLSSPSFSSTTFQNFPGTSELRSFRSVEASAPYKAMLRM